jgi:glycosyltransferase involved in cell wall biosynthesis
MTLKEKLPELSIFFPFWNEEENIEEVVTRAASIAGTVAKKWEIIIVDDGSKDDTYKISQSLEKKDSRIRVIRHTTNRGYGAALKTGLEHASYEYVVFTDGDLQFDFSEVTKFIEKINNSDLVIGYRTKRSDSTMRHILMLLHRLWVFFFFRFYVKDIDCGFKMFRSRAIDAIMPLRSEGAMITTEILAKAHAKKLKFAQVGVNHYPRKYGTASGANFSVILRAILETFILYYDIKSKRF